MLNWMVENKWIKSWSYEPRLFRFPDKVFKNGKTRKQKGYIPDFRVELLDGSFIFYEVKGFMDSGAIRKKKLMAEHYPDVVVIMIDSDEYRRLDSDWSKMIPHWEGRKFKASDEVTL